MSRLIRLARLSTIRRLPGVSASSVCSRHRTPYQLKSRYRFPVSGRTHTLAMGQPAVGHRDQRCLRRGDLQMSRSIASHRKSGLRSPKGRM